MKSKEYFNVLKEFDFGVLNDPEFKEDGVREEIITPIIKALGYGNSQPYKIIRSRRLLHPFVSIGSKRKNIHIIPDYVFEVNNKPAWILDAKAPGERLAKSKHVEQAYSYAIHSEVRASYFGLCNGEEFVLYHISKVEPILHFNLTQLGVFWENLQKYLLPEKVFEENPFNLSKDLGLHLKRLGFDKAESLHFIEVPVNFIGEIEPGKYSFSAGMVLDDTSYVSTWDFNETVLDQLENKIPQKAFDILKEPFNNAVKMVRFNDRSYLVNVACHIGDNLAENKDEIFLPMIIDNIES